MYSITRICGSITETHKTVYTGKNERTLKTAYNRKYGKNFSEQIHHFRLLDDDGIVYFYGISTKETFAPLDKYGADYGVTDIQYKNDSGKYESL